MNLIDRVIEIFNPEASFRRERYRAAMEILRERRFDGAARGRRTANLPVGDSSANNENATQLAILRSRSRHFARNNSYAKRGFKSIANNTIGTGIIPAPYVAAKGRMKTIRKVWKDWAGKKVCDFDGRMNFYGIQRLAMRTIAESGEVLILRRRYNKGPIPVQLQVLEPDFLDASKDIDQLPTGGWITQGIEFDPSGRRKGYWIHKSHPLEAGWNESRFVPAADVLHIYELVRPGQVRGVPFIHSAMMRINDFDDYEDAELVRQKIAACFTAFVVDADPANSGSSSQEDQLERLEPGVIEHLPPGKQIQFAQPPTTQNYETYSRSVLRGIAAGMDVTYEAMTGDLSNVNFSSGRMGWLEMQRQILDWQWNMIIPQLCEGVWDWFVEGLQMGQGINAADADVTWTPPRREMIDPVKETQAINQQVRSGFMDWEEAVREQGYEPEEQLQRIAEWQKKLDTMGVKLDSDARNPANGGGAPADANKQEPKPGENKK